MFKLKLVNKPKMMKLKCNFTFPNIVLANLQEKEVQATKEDIEVVADVPYDGLSKVDIKGYKLNLQEKKATPTKEMQQIIADQQYDGLSKVVVNHIPDEYIIPSGEINISQNGIYDVKDKASVNVNVENENNASVETITSSGSYNDKLNTIIKKIPKIIFTIKGANLGGIFSGTKCEKIEFEASPLRAYAIVSYCTKLKELSSFDGSLMIGGGSSCISGAINLEIFGGIINLGKAFSTTSKENNNDYQMNVSQNTKLTHESLMNVINGLYDIKTKGCNPQQLIVGTTNLAKLTSEEIAIATNKGWTVS